MMNNLFSIFDPISIFNLSLNWLSSTFFILMFPKKFYFYPNRIIMLLENLIKFLICEFKSILFNNKFIFIPIMMFLLIMNNNIFSLIPYIFSSTSHMQLNMLMSFPIWISIMIFGWTFNMNNMFCHLVPNSTPIYLMNFMVLIETISNMIRPMTLMVRLTANLIAGHLLLSLLSSIKFILSYQSIMLLIFIQFMLITLEMSVALIQAYVFSLLICLYFMDSN
uniref:ATP synthase subunit a n=1 Tax=Plectrocnemia tortosa TaxID=623669 RepID=A0A9E8LP70_9NEOP|nr:ATP synthase F0 subunit 6 [Plectrocnemia tortosa]UZZ44264.1 ATP synthase F0 subunit 6 [Plectrocnemia tortosa]